MNNIYSPNRRVCPVFFLSCQLWMRHYLSMVDIKFVSRPFILFIKTILKPIQVDLGLRLYEK